MKVIVRSYETTQNHNKLDTYPLFPLTPAAVRRLRGHDNAVARSISAGQKDD